MIAEAATQAPSLSIPPWLLQVGALAAGVLLIATLVSSRTRDFLASFRSIASDKDDADIKEMKRQIDHLVSNSDIQQRTITDMRERQIRQDEILLVHRQWDLSVQEDPMHARRKPPPPLYPIQSQGG